MENSRLRSFYSRKVENLQSKYLSQVAAIRRGVPPPEDQRLRVEDGRGASSEAVNELQYDSVERSMGQSERSDFLNRIAIMEQELLRTAEELGEARAAAAVTNKVVGVPSSSDFAREREALESEVGALRYQIDQLTKQLESTANTRNAVVLEKEDAKSGNNQDGRSMDEGANALRKELVQKEEALALLKQQVLEGKHEHSRLESQLREMNLRQDNEMSKKDHEVHQLQSELRLQSEQLRKPPSPELQNFIVR